MLLLLRNITGRKIEQDAAPVPFHPLAFAGHSPAAIAVLTSLAADGGAAANSAPLLDLAADGEAADTVTPGC